MDHFSYESRGEKRNFRTPEVPYRVPWYKMFSKLVLENTDPPFNWVLMHSIWRYSVFKIAVCWWSNLTFNFFSFWFFSKQFITFFQFYFIQFFQFWKLKQIKFWDLTGLEVIWSLSDHSRVVRSWFMVKIGMFSTNK